MEARHQPGHPRQSQRARRMQIEDGAEAVQDRLGRGAEREGAGHGLCAAQRVGHDALDRDRRVEQQHEEAERDQREHAEHDALRHVALGID